MNSTDRAILTEFRIKRNLYISLEKIVTEKLASIINDNHFFVMDISHRTKEVESLEGKLSKKSGKYKSIYDITDLVGFRVICYFSDTIDLIAQELDKNFIIDFNNSVDKRKTLKANEFGYLSLHYICSLRDQDCPDDNLKNIKFELQLRSVLQHAWAEIEHDLGYKSSYEIPRSIRRDFSRIASLLELADKQFIELKNNVSAYENMVNNKIISNNANDISIDRVSLNAYICLNSDFIAFTNRLQTDFSVSIENINAENYIEQLQFFGVENIKDLCQLFSVNKELIYTLIKEKIETYELDIISSSMILRYMCRAELINNAYSRTQIERFLAITTSDKNKLETQTNKILEKIQRLQ